MPVIAVINRKGGSGKSTLAAHLAAHCASEGMPVMLGDIDRQQSMQSWLREREKRKPAQRAPIVGWTVDPTHVRRPPAGVSHAILDTPGGLRGFDLARVVMFADAILMPVCNSAFDRDSAAECVAELMTLPRVATGRCRMAALGMRIDARTKAAEVLAAWADLHRLPFVGVLRESQSYVRSIEQGLTLFDMPHAQVQADMAQWRPILDWLSPVLQAESPALSSHTPPAKTIRRPIDSCPASRGGGAAAPMPRAEAPGPAATPTSRAEVPMPATPTLPARAQPRQAVHLERQERRFFSWLPIPRFLQR